MTYAAGSQAHAPVPGTPAGWYPDPWSVSASRWWSGSGWTPHTRPVSTPPPARSPGLDTNTVWIWLIVLLPLTTIVLSLFIPWGSLFHFDVSGALDDPTALYRSQLEALTSPQLWLVTLLSYVVAGLLVYFAYLDHRRLLQLGIQRPFHWAFAFLGTVYPIGRSVIVAQRTGKGRAPMWTTIALYVVATAVSTIEVAIMMNGLIDGMQDLWSSLHELVPPR